MNEKKSIQELYIDSIDQAIQFAREERTKLTQKQFDLRGLSSKNNRILLNELVASLSPNVTYLEIGSWYGSTLISALYQNQITAAYAIDNFSTSDIPMPEKSNYDDFMEICIDNEVANFTFFNEDCFELAPESKNKIRDVNLYFYDGDHKEIDQKMALTYYIDCLSETFIYIVDDWEWADVKNGTRSGIKETGIQVIKEWELSDKINRMWWNGLFIAVCKR